MHAKDLNCNLFCMTVCMVLVFAQTHKALIIQVMEKTIWALD